MKCEKCKKAGKPFSVKAIGVAGTFTWSLCEDHTPKNVPDKPFTADQINELLTGASK
jgi:hypothetical protein